MRARQFILEYNQAKTAQVFGNKLLSSLALDKSYGLLHALGTGRAYLQQKNKIGAPYEEQSKQVIIKDILSSLEISDPTPNKEYVQWLAKCYANESVPLEDIMSKGLDWLKQYHQFKIKRLLPDNLRNIANIKFKQLHDIIDNDELIAKLDALENVPLKDKGESKVVYEDSDVRIIVPLDETSACYYGQGTQWCTAAKNNNMFARYNRGGPMYILLPKNPTYDGEKYQFHFNSDQFMDEQDSDVGDLKTLLLKRFNPDVLNFFMQAVPEMSTWVTFASDDVINPIVEQIANLASEKVWDILAEWESDDHYYFVWLGEQGYYNEEDNTIDWERVAEDNIDYMKYNDDAKEWYDDIQDALRPDADTARELASTRDEEYGGRLLLTDFEKVIVYNIVEHGMDGSYSDSVTDFISDRIYVRKDDQGYYVQAKDQHGKLPQGRES